MPNSPKMLFGTFHLNIARSTCHFSRENKTVRSSCAEQRALGNEVITAWMHKFKFLINGEEAQREEGRTQNKMSQCLNKIKIWDNCRLWTAPWLSFFSVCVRVCVCGAFVSVCMQKNLSWAGLAPITVHLHAVSLSSVLKQLLYCPHNVHNCTATIKKSDDRLLFLSSLRLGCVKCSCRFFLLHF